MTRVSRIVIPFVVGFTFISLLLFLVFITLNLFIDPGKTPEALQNSKSYMFQEISTSSLAKSTSSYNSYGFVEMNRELSEDEFLSYSSPNGNQIVISNFASSQFKCEGTCSCRFVSDLRRLLSSNQLSLPLFLIFSAISSTLALKIAEKSFRDQCSLHFSSSCDEENIQSSVSSCSEEEKESTTINNEEEKKKFAEYYCEGYCIPSKTLKSVDAQRHQKEYLFKTGGCEKLKTSANIKIERKANENEIQKQTLKRTGEVKEYPNRYQDMYRQAQRKFSKYYMISFCKEMSQEEYWWHSPTNPSYRKRQKSSFCVGGGDTRDFPDDRLDYKNQNMKCMMTSESKIVGRVVRTN